LLQVSAELVKASFTASKGFMVPTAGPSAAAAAVAAAALLLVQPFKPA
jgi:negative regulator of sigma E activity